MNNNKNRLARERKTIEVMLKMYCKNHHYNEFELCEDCNLLLKYALNKIDKCVFGQQKPVCSECKIHCYAKEMRNKIKEIMRYSGPRMLLNHPYLAIMHIVDKRNHKNKYKN
ncbi:MAG: hypothetical protein COS14_03270 [Bacteroidetes bacterium CG02_land_8_20_14_3_00_31_25]|nr:nitrous oxide-stimulated promoter family protein [Bacteroidota bacterium]PIV62024.1 MAG: hypothetical protein COS14_03270 [Bacteroidetes bacterium CG02_land_8_20_14_3_00_31_25]PIX35951.1 MAG: hypothetical protein COZ59_03700 [Bacteroidetes bacterium CG_4_8_14_3_um_filter_31_14]PIY07403.1 MAG: hypothetical protein COZ21_00460 [Bacteroidetes bacterium CG_4_10_14_3_um_filter_31_20]